MVQSYLLPYPWAIPETSPALRVRDAANIIKALGPYRDEKTEGIIIRIVNNFTATLGFSLCYKNSRQHTKMLDHAIFTFMVKFFFTINIFYGQRLKFSNFYT